MRVILFGVAMIVATGVQAKVYKCVGADGAVTFSGVPCTDAQEVEHIEIKDNHIGGQFSSETDQLLRELDREIAKQKRAAAPVRQTACKNFSEQRIRTWIIRGEIYVGMKMADVHKSWGRPSVIDGNMHVWRFRNLSRYVFERDGCAYRID